MDRKLSKDFLPTQIGNKVYIGSNSSILPVSICDDVVIGAGSVVTKHIPAYALVVGNPARQIGWMSEYGHRLNFDESGIAICPESNDKYELIDNQVRKI